MPKCIELLHVIGLLAVCVPSNWTGVPNKVASELYIYIHLIIYFTSHYLLFNPHIFYIYSLTLAESDTLSSTEEGILTVQQYLVKQSFLIISAPEIRMQLQICINRGSSFIAFIDI